MKALAPKLLALVFVVFLYSCSNDSNDDFFEEDPIAEEPIAEEPVKENPADENTFKYSEIESKILELVNHHRESIGLNILEPLDLVSKEADSHSNYMVEKGKLSHDNFPERSKNLIDNAKAQSVGENVAYGYTSAQSTVNGWLGSNGHRDVIEGSKFTHFGVSTEVDNKGKNYYTLIFISK